MGTKMAVVFANIFMAKTDEEMPKQSCTTPIFWKRFIGDVISMWDTGLEIIFGHLPVKMTGQIHFSLDIPRFWPDKYNM